MQYFAGALITLIVILFYSIITKKLFSEKGIQIDNRIRVSFNQSYIYNLLLPFMPNNQQLSKLTAKKTQAQNHKRNAYVKIVFMDGKAYWITNNKFFTADMEDGKILQETVKLVDTMTMDKIQLNKISFIVDKLREGLDDDNRNSRKS